MRKTVLLLGLVLALCFFSSATAAIYEVQPGDTISGIAKKFGTTPQVIIKINPQVNSGLIKAGDKLAYISPGDLFAAQDFWGREFARRIENAGNNTKEKRMLELAASEIGLILFKAVKEPSFLAHHFPLVISKEEMAANLFKK